MIDENKKQRLFEVMSKVDSSFKLKLNENIFDKYTYQVNQPDYQGTIKRSSNGWMLYDIKNMPEEAGPFSSIESLMQYYEINPNEISKQTTQSVDEMSNWGKTKANPKYSHFAVLKGVNPAVDGKIINGWEYRDYDPAELRQFKKDYFFQDIIDNQINPKLVNIVTAKHLQKQGIDPYDYNNWYKNDKDHIFTT